MKILALDPATKTGFAVTRGPCGIWNLSGHLTHAKKLSALDRLIRKLHAEHRFEAIAFEDASFGSANPEVQAFHNMIRGVILLVAETLGLPTFSYKPTTIKKFATGDGRAKKAQMMRACHTHFGFIPMDDNVADARFILAMAEQGIRTQDKSSQPKRKRARKPSGKHLF